MLRAANVVLHNRVLAAGTVEVRDGRIRMVAEEPGAATLEGAWLLPGYIDLHWHGYGGHALLTADDTRAAVRGAAASGVTTCYAGLGHGMSREEIVASVEQAASVVESDTGGARLAGIFMEGPYISLEKKGAWSPKNLRAPRVDELETLIAASRGTIRRINVAPELPGALDFIRAARRAGILVSLGHSNASYDEAQAGVEAGATIANHTYNAMSGLGHRAPGLVGAVLGSDALLAELILDGQHVDPVAALVLYRARGPHGVALITDGSQLTGMPSGTYERGGRTLTIEGVACLLPDGTLAGSVSPFDRDVRNARRWLTDDPLALAAISSGNAARAMGIAHETGSIAPGLRADLVLLDEEWQVLATVVGGNVVYRRDGAGEVGR